MELENFEDKQLHKYAQKIAKLYESEYYINFLTQRQKQKDIKRLKIRYFFRIAAIIFPFVFLIGGYFYSQSYSNENIVKSHFALYEISEIRGQTPSDEDKENYILGKAAYKNKNYQKAVELLLMVSYEGRVGDYYICLANALMKRDKPKKAIEYLLEGKLRQSPEFQQRVEWYLALAYLADNQEELAKKELNNIVNDSLGYEKEAMEILQCLNSSWRKFQKILP